MQTKVITEVPETASRQINFLADDEGDLKKQPFKIVRNDIIGIITDPDNNPIAPEEAGPANIIPVMERGGLSRTTGEETDRPTYLRTSEYIPISPGAYTFTNTSGYKICILLYGPDYGFIESWNEGYSYAWATDGMERVIPAESGASFLRFYTDQGSDLSTIFTIIGGNLKKCLEFKRIYIGNGQYFEAYEIDPGLYGTRISKDESEFNIFAIRAPKEKPHEATLALICRGKNTIQFVDVSCMRYDETSRGGVEIVMQSRNDTPLPRFIIAFNDGLGAGRVRKFTVEPDAIPIRMTSTGLEIRRNNHYDNNAKTEELVTVDLIALKEKVDKIYTALIANGTITE